MKTLRVYDINLSPETQPMDTELGADLFYQIGLRLVVGIGTVREIDSRHVHAGLDQFTDDLLCLGGRT
jgi:hypothetical protein